MGSSACSASTNAAIPPAFCASAITWSVIVVFPEDSGPKTSITRPRGKPPTPSAASKEIAPVEMTEIGTIASFEPSRMIDPLPNCFSICERARSIARDFSSAMLSPAEVDWITRGHYRRERWISEEKTKHRKRSEHELHEGNTKRSQRTSQRFSRSTGLRTSCTLKYFAREG